MISIGLYVLQVLVLVSVITKSSGEEAKINRNVFKHPLTDMPGPAANVVTDFQFPNFPDQKFPIGEHVVALCHFSNEGPIPYNISAIMGSLNSPFDFRHHFQNYSYKPLGVMVNPGEEISLKYDFQLHTELEPVEYQLVITVFYDSDKESFTSTFFNETVDLSFPSSEYDLESFAAVFAGFGFLVAIGFLTVVLCFPETKLASELFTSSKGTRLQKDYSSDDDESWQQVQRNKAKASKKKK